MQIFNSSKYEGVGILNAGNKKWKSSSKLCKLKNDDNIASQHWFQKVDLSDNMTKGYLQDLNVDITMNMIFNKPNTNIAIK